MQNIAPYDAAAPREVPFGTIPTNITILTTGLSKTKTAAESSKDRRSVRSRSSEDIITEIKI